MIIMLELLKQFFLGITSKCERHQWVYLDDIKHHWSLENGVSNGQYNPIDRAIAITRSKGLLPDVTSVERLLDWKSQGFNAVRTSWHRYECKNCQVKHMTEFYTHPFYSATINPKDSKKSTVIIRTYMPSRKEIAVEPLTRFGE